MSNKFDILLKVTTDASGDGTATATKSVAGWIEKIRITDGDLADAHTLSLAATLTPEAVDETIWSTTAGDTNSDAIAYPRIACTDEAFDALSGQYNRLYAAGLLKLTVAAGGDTKTGSITVYMWD